MTQHQRTIRIIPAWESTRQFTALVLTTILLVSSIPSVLFAQAEIEINKEETRGQGSETPPPTIQEPGSEVKEQRQVRVQRRIGNPMGEIFKDTLYGALTGLLVGGILVAIDSKDSDATRRKLSTSTAVGAGVGLLYGVFVVTSMERQVAAIEWDRERFVFNVPQIGVTFNGPKGHQNIGVETALLRAHF